LAPRDRLVLAVLLTAVVTRHARDVAAGPAQEAVSQIGAPGAEMTLQGGVADARLDEEVRRLARHHLLRLALEVLVVGKRPAAGHSRHGKHDAERLPPSRHRQSPDPFVPSQGLTQLLPFAGLGSAPQAVRP